MCPVPVVSGTGHNMNLSPMGFYHIDLLGRRSFRHEYLTPNPSFCTISRNAVPGITAAVLHHKIHAYGFTVGYENCRAPVLKGQSRHKIVHFQQNIIRETDDGSHSLSKGDVLPGIIQKRHKRPVPETTVRMCAAQK